MKNVPKLRKPLTKKGHAQLAEEHFQLAKVERPKVVEGIATAAAEGDRSENAEYIYGKKRLRELDKRLRYLNHLLKDAQIIDIDTLEGDQVCFGCTVLVIDEDSKEHEWMIVGEGESDFETGKISWKSPVARALWGKKVGDIAIAIRPAGEIEFEIIDISFQNK